MVRGVSVALVALGVAYGGCSGEGAEGQLAASSPAAVWSGEFETLPAEREWVQLSCDEYSYDDTGYEWGTTADLPVGTVLSIKKCGWVCFEDGVRCDYPYDTFDSDEEGCVIWGDPSEVRRVGGTHVECGVYRHGQGDDSHHLELYAEAVYIWVELPESPLEAPYEERDRVRAFYFGDAHYIVFPEPSDDFDPRTAPYVSVPGAYDVTLEMVSDGSAGAGPIVLTDFPLPARNPLRQGFVDALDVSIRIADSADNSPPFECEFHVFPDGRIEGALIIEPGVLLCSTHNWDTPQSPAAPGLLLTYGLCRGGTSSENCATERPPSPQVPTQ